MAKERGYNEYIPFDRPKLPRNKYGLIDVTEVSGSSLYGGSGGSGGATYNLGGEIIGAEDIMVSLSDFVGATRSEDGKRGFVPAPLAGQNQYFLQGNGQWTRIPAFEWFTEFPESIGLEKSGLQLNGDLNVTETLTVKNLKAESAHFWELVIDKVKAQGGTVLVSPSAFQIDYIGEIVQYPILSADQDNPLRELLTSRTDIYNALVANDVQYIRCRRLYQKCDDGEKRIRNECEIGDMLRCRSFNLKAGTYRNVSNTDYWSFVCNRDLDNEKIQFTDEEGNTFDAIYIDLAFTLRTSEGRNYPIGTILYTDGREPVYPEGWEEIFGPDVDRLKEYSQDTLDGTRDVIGEYYENEEWTSIQESVIKIRGLDDQLKEITGKKSSDNLYDKDEYLSAAADYMQEIIDGEGTSDAAGRRNTPLAKSRQILTGDLPINTADDLTQQEDLEVRRQTLAIQGNNKLNTNKLDITLVKGNKLPLKEGTSLERDFIVADDVVEYVDNQEVVIYEKGEVIHTGDEIIHDVNVIDKLDDLVIKKDIDDQISVIPNDSQEGQDIIENTQNTQSDMDRNPNNFIDMDYSQRTEWQFGYTSDYTKFRIKAGDALACLGHLYDSTRQNAIVLSAVAPLDIELQAPSISQYSHIDTFGLYISKFRQTALSANGNEFIGSFLVNYNNTYVDINDKINMMILDVKTGLESVGIHLDGEKSSISLVGSVDLKQHSQDSYDTLNLYDNLGVKRVEIKPFDIPAKNSSDSQIDNSKLMLTSVLDKKNIPTTYVNKYSWKNLWDGILFHYTWVHEYTVQNYAQSITTSLTIGHLEGGYTINLADLQLKIKTNLLLAGTTPMTDRGLGRQKVNSVKYVLKRNGVQMLAGTATGTQLEYNSDSAGTINIYWADLYSGTHTVPGAGGTYTLDITVEFELYGYVKCGTEYNNYYVTANCELTGNISSEITRVNTTTLPGRPYTGYKFTIGTNGFTFFADDQKYFYCANDGFELKWGENTYISFDDQHGIYFHPLTQQAEGTSDNNYNFQLGNKAETVFCKNTHVSYTVTLPDPTEYGIFRKLTILGWVNADNTKLTIAAKTGSNIEANIQFMQQQYSSILIPSFEFNSNLTQAVTLIATGASTWRIISYV